MNIQGREDNVVFVTFGTKAPAERCAECPFRRCCSCAHWDKDTRTCLRGANATLAPTTAEDDWCGRWEARALELVAVDG